MTRSSPDAVGATLDANGIALPLVSVVIVNFNYGRFLGSLVDSIFAQTYANIECIAVDNASTDDSLQILAALAERHPLKIIARGQNDGQTPASLDGLGPFGTFWRVILPLARPGLAVTAFYTFLTAWGEVAYAIAFMQSDKQLTLGAGLQQFVPAFNPQWENLTAGAVLIMLPAAVVFFFAQKHLVAGLTAGGTKG